jgi:hypothetical protein
VKLLIPRPSREDLLAAQVVVFLDIDGVINRLTDDEFTDGLIVRDAVDESGRTYTFRVREQLLDGLDEQLHRPGVVFGFLTTWGTPQVMLALLADGGPFAGRLRGGFIWEDPSSFVWRASDWKLRAVQNVLTDVGEDKPFIWAEDQMTNSLNPRFRSQTGPRLLLQPHRAVGLHPINDVRRIAAFIDEHTSPPPS